MSPGSPTEHLSRFSSSLPPHHRRSCPPETPSGSPATQTSACDSLIPMPRMPPPGPPLWDRTRARAPPMATLMPPGSRPHQNSTCARESICLSENPARFLSSSPSLCIRTCSYAATQPLAVKPVALASLVLVLVLLWGESRADLVSLFLFLISKRRKPGAHSSALPTPLAPFFLVKCIVFSTAS